MELCVYERMVSELSSLMDAGRVSSALSCGVSGMRVGMLQDIMRDGFRSSTLSMYNGVMHWFNGCYYEPLSSDEFSNLVYDVLRGLGALSSDMLRVEGVTRVLRRCVQSKVLLVNNSLMVFRNCVYDISSGSERSFSPECVSFSSVPYDHDGGARCFRWMQFLDEVLPHKSYQQILQEFIGALFVDRHKVKIEKLLILKGSGSNGKSVVFEVVTQLLGRSNVSNFGLDELLGSGQERKRNVATMNGKRLNYASETQQFVVDGSSGSLKALISGEPMEARAMYGDNFTAYDIPLIMINTNHMPEIRDYSHGMRRRLMLLPFEVEIPRWKQDASLASELSKELPGIFNWAMEGLSRFRKNGYKFTENKVLQRMVDECHADSSSVLRFMLACGYERESPVLKDAVPIWTPYSELYEEYRRWCITNDESPESKISFSRALSGAGYKRRRSGQTSMYALFGERAISRQHSLLMYKRAAAEYNSDVNNMRHHNANEIRTTAERIMSANGWHRCAVGFTELQSYLGYTFNCRSHLNSGKLEGSYEVCDGIFYFNLDTIDREWRPKYEKAIKERFLRKQADDVFNNLLRRVGSNAEQQ